MAVEALFSSCARVRLLLRVTTLVLTYSILAIFHGIKGDFG